MYELLDVDGNLLLARLALSERRADAARRQLAAELPRSPSWWSTRSRDLIQMIRGTPRRVLRQATT